MGSGDSFYELLRVSKAAIMGSLMEAEIVDYIECNPLGQETLPKNSHEKQDILCFFFVLYTVCNTTESFITNLFHAFCFLRIVDTSSHFSCKERYYRTSVSQSSQSTENRSPRVFDRLWEFLG